MTSTEDDKLPVKPPKPDHLKQAETISEDDESKHSKEIEVFIDPETGKELDIKKIEFYKMKQQNQVSPLTDNNEKEDNRFFRGLSSFARWQIQETDSTIWISWNGNQKYAYFSMLVMFVTFVIILVEISMNGWTVEPFGVNPVFGPKREVLIALGAKRTDLIQKGDFYRLIAAWWIHGGVLHWIINMLALYNLGFSLEKEFGSPKITLLFCTCGFMGVLASAVFLPNVVGVGASGAIFGLFGGAWADLIQNWGLYKTRGNSKSVLFQLIVGTVINLLLGFCPFLDQFSHLAGLLTGVSLGCSLFLHKKYTRFGEEKAISRRQLILKWFGLITVPLAIIFLLVVLYTMNAKQPWCSWCSYINCIPIQGLWNCDDSGCSDDPHVSALYFPNKTLVITCPSTVGKSFSTTMLTQPTAADVVHLCREQCFL